MNYLLSYPHSGNTLLRYLVEACALRPTVGYHKKSVHELMGQDIFSPSELEDPILIKRHDTKFTVNHSDKLILICRSVKAHQKREGVYFNVKRYENIQNFFFRAQRYQRLFIFYTKLIEDPITEIGRVLIFLGYISHLNRLYSEIYPNISSLLKQSKDFYVRHREDKPDIFYL